MAFRLISLNLNGIRSAATKGFVEWTASVGADCMGVQELKAQRDDIAGRFEQVAGLNGDRKSTRLNSSHSQQSRMPSSA